MSGQFPVSVRTVQRATVVFVLAVLVVASPALGLVDLTPTDRGPNAVGDGTANISVETVPTERVRMTHGRFGTDVVYLHLPPATVDVKAVTDRPRLVYVARVPALDFERLATVQLDSDTRGETKIRMDARAFRYERVANNTYRVELSLRVQSFEVNNVIYRRNVSVTAPTRDSR